MSFQPSSEVTIYKVHGFGVIILVKKPKDNKFYLFQINSLNGSIIFDGIENTSIFNSKDDAINFIVNNFSVIQSEAIVGQALVGVARYGPIFYILIVKSSQPIARLLNKHTIFGVTSSEFYKIPLPFYRTLTTRENRRIERIMQFPIDEYHFWCETKDFSKPLYSDENNSSFYWNNYWTKPFQEIGQEDACIHLFQGTAMSQLINLGSQVYRFSLITTREYVNGGTRFYARGIDDENHPANEVQCNLIVESNDGKVWTNVWRRGSIPLKWSSVMAKNLPTVSIVIHPNPSENTHFYFEDLHKLFPDDVFCVNLLHNQPGNSEQPLCAAYKSAVKDINNVSYNEFDWHHTAKEKTVSGAVKELYKLLPSIDISYSHTDEELPIGTSENSDTYESKSIQQYAAYYLFPNEKQLPEIGVSFENKQTRTVRINCMDSLDRTNVVSFFYAAKALSKILELIGVSKEIATYEDLMALPVTIRQFLGESFTAIGDCISNLYTNSPACMTETFYEVSQSQNKAKKDSAIAVQRRFHNFLTDKKRHKLYSLFTGKLFDLFIPNVDCGNLPKCVSILPYAQFIESCLSDGKKSIDANSLLQISETYINSTTHTLILQLSEYCYVTDIYLVITPPDPPSKVKISYSLTRGPKLPLISKVLLPDVNKATPIHIKIPPEYCNGKNLLMRYLIFDFKNYKKSQCITYGNIFVFGRSTQNTNETKNYFNFIYQDIELKNDISKGFSPPEDNQTLFEFLKTVKKIDYDNFLKFETIRIANKIGRLKSINIATLCGFTPTDCNLINKRVRTPNLVISNKDKCLKCKKMASWKCVLCQKAFCSDPKCTSFNSFEEPFYFKMPSIVCDGCAEILQRKKDSVENILNGYDLFMKNLDLDEYNFNTFIQPFLNNRDKDPSVFPNAFFNYNINPKINLLLKKCENDDDNDDDFEVSSEKWEPKTLLYLGCPMKVNSIYIKGSTECIVSLTTPGDDNIIELTPGNNECDFIGREFYITLNSGTLRGIYFKGSIINSQKYYRARFVTNIPMYKVKKTKSSPLSINKVISVDLIKNQPIKGIVIDSFSGIRSVIIKIFRMGEIKPSSSFYFYIPEAVTDQFVYNLKKEITASRIDIQILDVSQFIKDPKILVF